MNDADIARREANGDDHYLKRLAGIWILDDELQAMELALQGEEDPRPLEGRHAGLDRMGRQDPISARLP